MLDAILGQVFGFVWFVVRELVGYFTGKAILQGLSFGRLSVADLGRIHVRPFSIFWREGRQAVVTGSVAVAVGYIFWIATLVGTVLLLGR